MITKTCPFQCLFFYNINICIKKEIKYKKIHTKDFWTLNTTLQCNNSLKKLNHSFQTLIVTWAANLFLLIYSIKWRSSFWTWYKGHNFWLPGKIQNRWVWWPSHFTGMPHVPPTTPPPPCRIDTKLNDGCNCAVALRLTRDVSYLIDQPFCCYLPINHNYWTKWHNILLKCIFWAKCSKITFDIDIALYLCMLTKGKVHLL